MKKKPVGKSTNMRRFTRVQPEPQAPVQVDINGDGFIELVKAVDVSEGGMRIQVPHRFEGCHIEKAVTFIIRLPKPINTLIRVEGRIKHVLQDSFGVQFSNLSKDARAVLRRYVEHRIKDQSFWFRFRYKMGWVD